MKKTILFVYSGECHKLPPFLTILDVLHSEYSLKVVSYETIDNQEKLRRTYPDVAFLSALKRPSKLSFVDKVLRHYYYPINFHKEVITLIAKTDYDLLWIIHEKTLVEFRSFLMNLEYVVSCYELADSFPSFRNKEKESLRRAKKVITCEYNRSCIMRVWNELDYTPPVIPNKPYKHPMTRFMSCSQQEVLKNKKIILYQGHIQKRRNIDKLCSAMNRLPEFTLALMGDGEQEYIKHIKEVYPSVLFIGYVSAPNHLLVTSHAYIGIVKYDFVDLNHLFCAPNKIWEYSGFGIPTLGNDLPGLEYTIGAARAGKCVDFDNIEAIVDAVKEIDNNYEEYSTNATRFYNSFDVEYSLKKLVKDILS